MKNPSKLLRVLENWFSHLNIKSDTKSGTVSLESIKYQETLIQIKSKTTVIQPKKSFNNPKYTKIDMYVNSFIRAIFTTAKIGSNLYEKLLRNDWEMMTPPSRKVVNTTEQPEKIITIQSKLYVKSY